MALSAIRDGTALPTANKDNARDLPAGANAANYVVDTEVNNWLNVTSALLDRARDVFNVKDYGAVGDGVTDDTAAIQAAFDECGTAGGGAICIPPGDYKVTAPLVPPNATNVVIYAYGATIHGTGFTGPILTVSGGGGATNRRGTCVLGLGFHGDGKAGGVDGVMLDSTSWIGLTECHFTSLRYGMRVDDAHDCLGFRGLTFWDNDTDIRGEGANSTSLHWSFCKMEQGYKAVEAVADITDWSFTHCGFSGGRIAGGSTTPTKFGPSYIVGLSFYRCRFEQGSAPLGISVTNLHIEGIDNTYGALGVSVRDCYFTGGNVTTHVYLGLRVREPTIEKNIWFATPTSYDIDYNGLSPPTIRENIVPPQAAREPETRISGSLTEREHGEIRTMKKSTALAVNLTAAAGVRSIVWDLAATPFPNKITQVEYWWQSASTAVFGGIIIKKQQAARVEIDVNVTTPGAADGTLYVIAYGY